MWICSVHKAGKFHDSNPDLRSDLPISAQGLPAGCRAGLPAYLWWVYPAVIFIRRLYGGLKGLPAGCVADWLAPLDKKFTSSIHNCWERK